MKKVFHVSELFGEKALKPIEFTHYLDTRNGWIKAIECPNNYEKVIYLGKCKTDGDMFVAYAAIGHILFFKGHLNDGVIE